MGRHKRRLHGEDYALRRARVTLARILRFWGEGWLIREIELEFSDRMSSSLGYCDLLRCRIRLSDELRQVGAAAVLHEVVCHEAAHMVAHVRWGPRIRPHGPEWASLLEEAGLPTRVRVPLTHGDGGASGSGRVLRKIDSRRLARAACRRRDPEPKDRRGSGRRTASGNVERARAKDARTRSKGNGGGRR